MKQYTIEEFKKIFEIFNNLKPILDEMVKEHNKIMSNFQKEYGSKPYFKDEDFNFIPESEYFDICDESQHFIFSEEIYLGGGDYEHNEGYIPFSWLTNSNWKEDFIKSEKKEFDKIEKHYLRQQEEEKNKKIDFEKKKLEEEKKQYELLKAKFEGEK